MCPPWVAFITVVLTLVRSVPIQKQPTVDLDLSMPGVQPKEEDIYLCTGMRASDVATYITGFVPHTTKHTAHHILLYTCEEPGSKEKVWACGEMSDKSKSYHWNPVCSSSPKIIYAWAMDAPELKLPNGVGFKIGDNTDSKWLVLQVHYEDVHMFLPPNNHVDHSGITLKTTTEPQPRRATVYLMGSMGIIPPNSTVYMEMACSINEPIVIHPFAFRTHAHSHGVVISGYRVRNGQWTEIGRASPQKPQMFYPTTTDLTVTDGDVLAARCTMKNDENRSIPIGATHKDEMCNFYMMYWADDDKSLSENSCFSSGPPQFSWSKMEYLLGKNLPLNASLDPISGKLFGQTVAILKMFEENMDKNFQEMLSELDSLDEELNPSLAEETEVDSSEERMLENGDEGEVSLDDSDSQGEYYTK